MISIGTWNLQNLFPPGGDGPKTAQDYDTKLAGLAATILASGVHAVAVQEVGAPEPFEDLRSRLGRGWTGILSALPDPRRGIRVGVLARIAVTHVADDADLVPGLPPLYIDDTRTVVTRMGRGALTVEVTTPSGATLTLTTVHLKSKLISYPGGFFEPRDEAQRARFGAYALFQRASEAATVRGVTDRLLAGEGRTRRHIVLGDLNDEPGAATTQLLLGPDGSEFGTAGATTPDKGDAWRLFNPAPLIPAERRFTRVYGQSRELIDHLLVSRALLEPLTAVDTVASAPLPSMGVQPVTTIAKPFSDHAMLVASFDL
jgi:endonuclease/exonuclease/phosphatase family metal-dependent hydrolase